VSTTSKKVYEKYGIDPTYDSQHTYGKRNSHFNNGKYPPDWPQRRDAVWGRQRYQCGRCGVYKGDVSASEVHHVVHLSNGGSNALENLVGLCGDCHALMHPDNSGLRGNPWQADLFPGEHADERVAVIRKPKGNDELEVDLDRLSQLSAPDENANAVTSATVPTSSTFAQRANTELPRILLDNGFVPRTTPYHRVSVRTNPTGLLSAITLRDSELTARGDGETLEVEENDCGADVYHASDTSVSEIELEDPAGERQSHELELAHSEGERLRVEKPISAPPLTVTTAPEYMLGALHYFGWNSLKIGLIPGLILAFIFPSVVPAGGSIVGVVAFILFIGLLIRSRTIYREVSRSPHERVVDERQE